MNRKTPVLVITLGLLCWNLLFSGTVAQADGIIADHSIIADFDLIPSSVFEQVKTNIRIFYIHTSHGSQIVSGMSILRDSSNLYDYNNGSGTLYLEEQSGDLGHNGDTSWVPDTRQRLVQPDCDINLVMWSWCGGCSDNTEEGINIYLNAVSQLEQDYPDVMFIYMTGHLDGSGPSGNLYTRNNQIRDYCVANDKILFDFADIESYDPDGTYYPDESDYCNWCYTWCSSHDCPWCSCSHSHCFNCWQKGKAFWWLLARVSGWSSSVGVEPDGGTDLPETFALEQNYPNPFNPRTEIHFTLPSAGHVKLEIFNIVGQKVTTIIDGSLSAGNHTIQWDGNDSYGRQVATGIYFYRLKAGGSIDTKKMVLLE